MKTKIELKKEINYKIYEWDFNDLGLSVERWPFHTEPPDHYALVSYLIDLSVSQSSALIPLYSTHGYQSC